MLAKRASFSLIFFVSSALVLTSCQTTGGSSSASNSPDSCATVMIMGALIGGLIGSRVGKGKGQYGAAAAGAALGAGVAGLVCKMSQQERENYSNEKQRVLSEVPANRTFQWKNPDSDVAATWVPKEEFKNDDGLVCRQMDEELNVRSEAGKAAETFCQNPTTGKWEPLS